MLTGSFLSDFALSAVIDQIGHWPIILAILNMFVMLRNIWNILHSAIIVFKIVLCRW